MNAVYEKLQRCYESMQEKTDFKPLIAVVLGSGLGGFAEDIQIETIVEYRDLPDFRCLQWKAIKEDLSLVM